MTNVANGISDPAKNMQMYKGKVTISGVIPHGYKFNKNQAPLIKICKFSAVFIVNFEHISHVFPVFLLLTLSL